MHSYLVSGLAVQSEIALPGFIPNSDGQAKPDVFIRRQSVPIALEGATQKGPTWEIAGNSFLLRVPGVARFLLTAGRDIAFESEDEKHPSDVAIFIIGTVFGTLLHQREQVVLHASAVRVGDTAVLFCGPSGAGKSTIAAALGQRGYPLVTDDFCAVTPVQDGAPLVHPDGRMLKLWEQAIGKLDLAAQRGEAVRNRLEKFYVEPSKVFTAPLRLGAVYVLREDRPPLKAGIERPNVVDAALQIRNNAYRPRMVVALQQKAQYFQSAANIAAKSGVFFLTRPLDFTRLPGVIDQLESHWNEIGLRGRET